MGAKDIAEKLLADYNDVFSDIFNVLLFSGEELIGENDLEEEHPVSQYKMDDSRLHEQERDVLKRWRNQNVRLAILGLEHQTVDEKYMTLRVISYDGAAYRIQLLDDSDSRTIVPVVTIVLYFGTKHKWNQPTSLKETMVIPKELEPYVNDYRIHVFNVAWLEPEQIQQFKSDFRLVAEFFRDKRLEMENFASDTTRIRHVDQVLKLLTAVTGDRSYEEILKSGEEVNTMCEVAQRLRNEGRIAGWNEGRATGWNEGKAAGWNEGRVTGWNEGKTAGWNEGKTAGWNEGKTAGWNEGILSQKKIDADIIAAREQTIAELQAKIALYEKQAQMLSGK